MTPLGHGIRRWRVAAYEGIDMWLERARALEALTRDRQASGGLSRVTRRLRGRLSTTADLAEAQAAFLWAAGRVATDEMTTASALALFEGNFVVGEQETERFSEATLLAAYWRILAGNRVHVVTTDDAAATAFIRWVRGMFELLRISWARLDADDAPPKRLRAVFERDVLVGSYERYSYHYLRDHAVVTSRDYVGPERSTALLIGGAGGLAAAAINQHLLRRPDSGQIEARMWGIDLLLRYERLSGELGPSSPDLAGILGRYDRSAVTIRASGEGIIEPGGPRKDALGFEDLAAETERMQRERLDDQRERILSGDAARDEVWAMFDAAIDVELAKATSPGEGVRAFLARYREVSLSIPSEVQSTARSAKAFLWTDVRTAYLERMESIEPKVATEFERRVMLTVLNDQWAQHLARLDQAFAAGETSEKPWDQTSEVYRTASHLSEQRMWETAADHVLGYLFHAPPTS